jgi:hypothetical protein
MNNVSLISKEFTKEAATNNIGIDCMLYTNCNGYGEYRKPIYDYPNGVLHIH